MEKANESYLKKVLDVIREAIEEDKEVNTIILTSSKCVLEVMGDGQYRCVEIFKDEIKKAPT